ncbi:Mannosylfructose-phosphate synthase [compost metagenome]
MQENYQILQICLSSSWGGLEMVALEMAEYFKAQGVLSCVSAGAVLEKKLGEKGMDFQELPGGKKSYFSRALALRKILKGSQIRVVLVQQLHDLWYLRLALIGLDHPPRIVGLSHTFVGLSKKDFMHKWIYSSLSKLICLTEVHKKNLLKYLPVSDKQLEVIPNAVSLSRFSPKKRSDKLRQEWQTQANQVLIGLVGRLDAGKGQDTLLEAAKILQQRGIEQFRIILVGEDTLNNKGTGQRLRDYVQQNGLEKTVVFTGFRQDVPEIMASLDVLVMASEAETFGRVIIEGMASGVPVIGTKAGGVVDIIDEGINGLLVPHKNPEALADALFQMIENDHMRKRMTQAALKKAESVYAEGVVMPQISKVLGSLSSSAEVARDLGKNSRIQN